MRYQWLLATAMLVIALLLGGCAAKPTPTPTPPPLNGTIIDPPMTPTDFTLTDQNGNQFSLSGAKGKVVVLTFLYTSCTDVCPTIGAKFSVALHQLGTGAQNVEFVGISVDPQRDTQARIQEFTDRLQLGGYPQWHFVTGSEAALKPLWDAYFIGRELGGTNTYFPSDSELQSEGLLNGLNQTSIANVDAVRQQLGGGYEVSHSTPTYLIDPQGEIRVEMSADFDPASLVSNIHQLLGPAS